MHSPQGYLLDSNSSFLFSTQSVSHSVAWGIHIWTRNEFSRRVYSLTAHVSLCVCFVLYLWIGLGSKIYLYVRRKVKALMVATLCCIHEDEETGVIWSLLLLTGIIFVRFLAWFHYISWSVRKKCTQKVESAEQHLLLFYIVI